VPHLIDDVVGHDILTDDREVTVGHHEAPRKENIVEQAD
jgi:hypothetical protein